MIVLLKLRLDVPSQDLAYPFGISAATISRIFSSCISVMDTRLSPLIHWPERAEIWSTMPECFQYSFGKRITVIIDCFEIFIEKSSNLLARAETSSSYKHHNTIKVLIGITPQGTISLCPMLGVVEHLTSFLLKIVVSWTSWYLVTWSWQTEDLQYMRVWPSEDQSW